MKTVAVLVISLLAAGCAGYGPFTLKPGVSTEAEVRGVMGNGVVRAVRPVLNDQTFSGIQPGMTRDQVLRLIGPPADTMSFARLRQVSWEYRFVDTWGYHAFFSVNFDENGIVVSKFTRRIERERGLF